MWQQVGNMHSLTEPKVHQIQYPGLVVVVVFTVAIQMPLPAVWQWVLFAREQWQKRTVAHKAWTEGHWSSAAGI